MKVRVINKSLNPLPAYETESAAGMDLRADIAEPLMLKPLNRLLIPTGLYVEIPAGYEAQVRPRSGLAFKHGVTVLNSPGTIDADYRGEIKVLLVNLSEEIFEIKPGDRIAQLIFSQHERVTWEPVELLSETQRGSGGYGHTGTH